ncbi:imm11 family protein [Ruegeria arenilitoris]|uniref:imm11 family protein n=1 Tax=Ruegeria arenilitoris TaxID=1173585 RepID=UPI001481CD15|nr:DUF1629 domain-containing protein [Ruegeria arenilitoris]
MTKNPMVWISYAMMSVSNIKGFEADVVLSDRKRTIEAMTRNRLGEVQPDEFFPKEVYAKYKDKKEGKQPDLFMAGGFWTVSSDCASVLRQFDLGEGKLYPVKLLQHDRTTPVEGEYFCLNFGSQKTAVLTDQSPRIHKPYENYDIWEPPAAMKDKDIAISASALDGPDIWMDTQMRDAFFVSDALCQALRAAKVSRPFALRKCIVI